MKVQIRKIDQEIALVFSEDAASELGLKDGDELHVRSRPDGSLRIDTEASLHAEAMRIAEKTMVDYAETFKALAKS